MNVSALTSRTKFAIADAASMAATLLSAVVTSDGAILAWGTRVILIILFLPIVVMTIGIACLMPPEILLILALIAAVIGGVPLQWVLMAAILLAVGYLILLFAGGARFRRQPLPFLIYEFGADRIVPYYAWLVSPRRALLSGVLFGMILGIAILWSKTMWHAVDSLSART